MKFKSCCILVFTILNVISIKQANCEVRSFAAKTPEDEQRLIRQFFSYVDVISARKLNNMIKMTGRFAKQLLDSIPEQHRGNTADLLQQYILRTEQQSRTSIQEKEQLLMELQQLIFTIKSGLDKQEQEDIILRRGMLGMFELLARLSIEEKKFNDKFTIAAKVLRQQFSETAIGSHSDLFNILSEINAEQDIVQREHLFKRFKEIRNNEIGNN